MDIIARKKSGVGSMYLVCALLGFIIIGVGIGTHTAFVLLPMGLAISGISGYIFVDYARLPYDVISIDRENNLILPKGNTVSIKDVLDVSYKRATARGIQYRWGTIKLKTRLGDFKYGYIADCEDVSKRLTDMMYRARFSDTDNTTNGEFLT